MLDLTNSKTKSYNDLLASVGFQVQNDDITRITNFDPVNGATGTLIDHIGHNEKLLSSSLTSSIVPQSDHCFIVTSVSSLKISRNFSKSCFTKINYKNIQNTFASLTNQNVIENWSENELALKDLKKLISQITANNTSTMTIKHRVDDDVCSWFNVYTLKLHKKMFNLREKIDKRLLLGKKADKLSNKLSLTISKLKECIFNERVSHYNRTLNYGTKKTWQLVNEVCGNAKNSKENITLRTGNGLTSNDHEIALKFHEQFLETVGSTQDEYLHNNQFLHPINDETCVFFQIGIDDMHFAISKLNINKSSGVDEIPARMIKENFEFFAPILTSLFNEMVEKGTYLDEEKIAKVIPVFKKGDRLNAANYRPVSILNTFNKLFESILHDQLSKFVSDNNLEDPAQFGFRSNRGCPEAIACLTGAVSEIVGKGNKAIVVSFDIEKAFDSVNHKLLLLKLERIGIRGQAKKLIESYLMNRHLFVRYRNANSPRGLIQKGVPQGSCLAPLLFNLFLLDSKFLRTNSKLLKFADDLVLIYDLDLSCPMVESTSRLMNDLQQIDDYYNVNLLKLNKLKSKFIIIGNETVLCSDIIAMLQDFSLQQVNELTYLGILIDSYLSFEPHAEKLRSTILKSINALRILKRNGIGFAYLLQFYYAHIHSHLSFCGFILLRTSSATIQRLQRLQNRALKIVYNLPILTRTQILFQEHATKTLPLIGIISLSSIMIVKKAMYLRNSVLPTPVFGISKRRPIIILAPHKKEILKHDVFVFGAKLFNQLSEETKKILNPLMFKNNMKGFLLRHIPDLMKKTDIKNVKFTN